LNYLGCFGVFGYLASRLPVFVFGVIIATMPVITLIISTAVGHETLGVVPVMSVALGFAGAMVILWDTARITSSGDTSLIWVGILGIFENRT